MSADSNIAVTVEVADTPESIMEARRFQAERYLQVGFVDSVRADGVIEDEWVETSTYHVARGQDGQILGVCRFVRSSQNGLPMFEHFDVDSQWDELIWANRETTYEMGALAADPSKADMSVGALLYRQTVRQFRVHPGQVHLLAALDSKLLKAMRRFMHFPFEQIGEPRMLVGGESTPVYLYLPSALEEQITHAPDAARFFSGFDQLELLEEEIIDLRSKYPRLEPADVTIDLTEPDPEKVAPIRR